MTAGCNLFKNSADMPPDGTVDVVDAPVKVRQVGRDGQGALTTYKLGAGDISVQNVKRPRRGYDY